MKESNRKRARGVRKMRGNERRRGKGRDRGGLKRRKRGREREHLVLIIIKTFFFHIFKYINEVSN